MVPVRQIMVPEQVDNVCAAGYCSFAAKIMAPEQQVEVPAQQNVVLVGAGGRREACVTVEGLWVQGPLLA